MGDIFRRNALNLGLHVVQCPDAVADAADGDVFSFEPVTRALRERDAGAEYVPLPLAPREDEMRRSGGIFTMGRREVARAVARHAARRVSRAGHRPSPDLDRAGAVGAPRRQGRRRASRVDHPCLRRPAAGL